MPMHFRFDTKNLFAGLETIDKAALGCLAMGVYDGAAIFANAVRTAVNNIKTSPNNIPGDRHAARLALPEEKAALQSAGVGISRFRKRGTSIETIIGHTTDYVMIRTRRVPIPLLANAINSGTSFMHGQGVYRKAFTKARQTAVKAIESKAVEELEKIGKDAFNE